MVTAYIDFELLRENQLGGKITPPPTQIRVKPRLVIEILNNLDIT